MWSKGQKHFFIELSTEKYLVVDTLLTMICMIPKVNLGVGEGDLGFLKDSKIAFAGGYKFHKFDFCFGRWHIRFWFWIPVAKSADPEEMPHNAVAFHHGLYFFLR